MPHATRMCETVEEFVEIHKAQLLSCLIPEVYYETLFNKLKHEIFDAGSSFMINQVAEELEDLEAGDDGSESVIVESPGDGDDVISSTRCSVAWSVIVSKPGGIKSLDPTQIYLIDHAWTYHLDQARSHLQSYPGLIQRMADLMEVDVDDRHQQDIIDDILIEMWRFNQTYNIGSAQLGTDAAVPLWYIMDEFGSRIQHSDVPSVRVVPFCYVPTQAAYSIMWPVRDIEEGDALSRDYLDGRVLDPLMRKLLMLPWQPDDMSHLSYELRENEEIFLSKYLVHESVPDANLQFPGLPRDRSIQVYSDVEQVTENLTDARFELVSTVDDADIIWTKQYLKDFRAFSEDTPGKMINQFPFEMVLTVKSVLPVVCRRDVTPVIDSESLNANPPWLPLTFNLNTEVAQFVSYFQHREARGMDNLWICKPFNLARGLDTHVTNNLGCILRLPESGPKIVSKYIEDPVLIDRDDVGSVKFDLRFVVLMTSAKPLELAVHQKFIVRVANRSFSLDDLDDYEKHFTVMNYKKGVQLKQIQCEDFIDMFDRQYMDVVTWSAVQNEIYSVIRKVFEAATACEPPKGIGHSPQSRAIYGVDMMLKWRNVADDGSKVMQPVVLEVNFGPDNTRLVRSHPDFYNDLFAALFLGDISGDSPIVPL